MSLNNAEQHIVLFGEIYRFFPRPISFGNTVQIVLPPHGAFNCGCDGCRVYRAIIKVQEKFNVHLGNDGPSTYSEEMQTAANYAAGILSFVLSPLLGK